MELVTALEATSIHRGSKEQIAQKTSIIEQLASSDELIQMWDKYRRKFSYADDIVYVNIMEVLRKLVG